MSAAEYVEAGLVLVPIPQGRKGPNSRGWNTLERCISQPADAFMLAGKNIGLAHAYSRTCAVDIDDLKAAIDWCIDRNIDLLALLMDSAAVQITSGRDNRGKLIYRLPADVDPLPSKKVKTPNGNDLIDFRCGTSDGLTVQDVLPPSIHPDTGMAYEWKGDWHNLPVLPDDILKIWRELAADNISGASTTTIDSAVDLNALQLSRFTRSLIIEGDTEGKYKSRSEAVFGAIKVLVRAGAADDLIPHVLTNPDYRISEKALENAHGDIQAAMRWVSGQIGKARAHVSGEQDHEQITSLPIDLDEVSLALAFAAKHKDHLRYCHTRKAWFRWDGVRWQQEKTHLAFHWARELCRSYNRNAHKPDKTISKVRTARAVEQFAMTDRRFAVTDEYWNADPWLLATPAGTVDLNTGNITKSYPDNHITLLSGASPENGTPALWLRFLDETTNGDRDLQRFLKQIAGYCLTGSTREHALFFLYGPGGNGKSVFVNVLLDILGEYGTNAPMDTFTASKYDRHPTDLADLAGARMVTASETEEGRAWAESRIKTLTGGDPIKARFMRQDFFQYVPQFKLLFLGNHKPVLNNVDDAARRRFNIIPFTFKPKKPDPDLTEKLRAEHNRILAWAIEGSLDWQQNGLQRPAVVSSATTEYFDEQDLFQQWLDECTEQKSERLGEPTTRLYKSWKNYAEQAGDSPGTQKAFRDNMRRHGYEHKEHLPNDHNRRGFIRISLNVETDSYLPYSD